MIFNRLALFRQFFSETAFCKSFKIRCFSSLQKSDSKKIKEIKDFVINQNKFDTNAGELKRSVLLYSNENSKFYQKLFILNVCQTFFWVYLANVGINLTLRKPKKSGESQNKDQPQFGPKEFIEGIKSDAKTMWNQHKKQALLSLGLLICGQISITLFTLFTIRSVRYIILSPGARNVRITTFSVTGSPNRYRNYDVPLEYVSAFQYRSSGGSYIPLKVKNKWFYFLIDSKGQFFKPSLFDQTVGVFRVLK